MKSDKKILFILITAAVLRLILQGYLWHRAGYFFICRGDGVGKALMAYSSMGSSFFHMLQAKFPFFHPMVVAGGLRLYEDVLITPVAMNIIFELGAVIVLFFISLTAFKGIGRKKAMMAGVVTFIFASTHYWSLWSSLQPTRDSLFRLVTFFAVFLWLRYQNSGKNRYAWLAGMFFMLSSATMHEGFFFAAVFAGFMFAGWFKKIVKVRKFDFTKLGALLFSLSYILMRIYNDYLRYGIKGYLKVEVDQNIAMWGSTLFERFVSYPKIIHSLAPWLIFLLLYAVIKYRKDKLLMNYFLFLVLEFALFIASSVIGLGYMVAVIPKFMLANLFLFVTFGSLGFVSLVEKLKLKRYKYTIYILICMMAVSLHFKKAVDPPKSQMRKPTIKVGRLLKKLQKQRFFDSEDRILIEQRVNFEPKNFSMAIEVFMLQIFGPESIIYDRRWNYGYNKEEKLWQCLPEDNPSVFEKNTDRLKAYIGKKNIKIIVFENDIWEKKVKEIAEFAGKIDGYNIYVIKGKQRLMNAVKEIITGLKTPWIGRDLEEPPFG